MLVADKWLAGTNRKTIKFNLGQALSRTVDPQIQNLRDFALDPGPADDIMAVIMLKTYPTKRGSILTVQALKSISHQCK